MLVYVESLFSWLVWMLVASLKCASFLSVVGICGLYFGQKYLLYLPSVSFRPSERRKRGTYDNITGYRSPADFNLPFEDHFIKCQDGIHIHAWLIKQPNVEQCPTLIFFHGNALNIGYRLPNAQSLYYKTRCNILLVDYRGYGNSEGSPSEKGLQLDAQATLDYITALDYIDHDKIYVFGRSLGGAVSIYLASRNQDRIRGVIIENTFSSLEDIVFELGTRIIPSLTKIERFTRLFLKYFMTSQWPSKRYIENITTPLLFISGLMDELIPPEQMHYLYTHANKAKKRVFYSVPYGTHNDTFLRDGNNYYERIDDFITRQLPQNSS